MTTSNFHLRIPRWRKERGKIVGRVDAYLGEEIVYTDELKLENANDRQRYAKAVSERLNGQALPAEEIESRLLDLMQQADAPDDSTSTSPASERTADGLLVRALSYSRKSTAAGGSVLARIKRSEASEIEVEMATFDAWIAEEILRDDERSLSQNSAEYRASA